MIIRALDSSRDWKFGRGIQDYNIEQAAIIENIDTRLWCFLNDCFFDKNSGLDWLRLLGTPGTFNELVLSCRAVILQSYGVVRLNSLSASISNRRATIQFNINTIYTSQFAASLEVG